MTKHRFLTILLLIVLVFLGYFVYQSQTAGGHFQKYAFKLGLDLNGGTELTYRADVSKVVGGDISAAMDSLRTVIERRVNIFGVSEPVVQTEQAGLVSGQKDYRLIVDLPGVTNIDQAIAMIGQTPQLEFMLVRPEAKNFTQAQLASSTLDQIYQPTGLTGQFLSGASLQFANSGNGQIAGAPTVALSFNDQGSTLFSQITTAHKGEILAIILDGQVISAPTIQDAITNGKAVINGTFTADYAKNLVQNLNYGALPVPITLVSSQTIGASLGQDAKTQGVKAGAIGFLLIVIFLIFWYRLPGFLASISLSMYIVLSLSIFKLIPVTLSAAGIAGFILSIGMAVDANILIFERMKEELKRGKTIHDALHEGFTRAWLSIRDSNVSSIITAIVLFWLGTSAIKGFALTLGLGVLISMFTAITVSRTFLFAVAPNTQSRFKKFLFSNGLHF